MEGKMIKTINDLEVIRCASSDEAETSISLEKNSKVASIYTSDNAMLTKLKKQWQKNPKWKCYEASRNSKNEVTGYFFEVPKKSISIRAGNDIEVSAERKAAVSNRIKAYHERIKNGEN